jgi:hypothetical protein
MGRAVKADSMFGRHACPSHTKLKEVLSYFTLSGSEQGREIETTTRSRSTSMNRPRSVALAQNDYGIHSFQSSLAVCGSYLPSLSVSI